MTDGQTSNAELARRVEQTTTEMVRRMEQIRTDIHDDLADVKGRIDQRLPREVYDAQRSALEQRVEALEARGRWLVGSIVLPIVIVVIQWLLAIKGVTP